MNVFLHHADSTVFVPTMPADSIDACVTDPPYHLTTNKKGGSGEASLNVDSPAGRSRVTTGFMGKQWDGGDIAFRPEFWREVFRVLKPGAYLVAFGGTRTYHRMACAIEDAGFEIRDQLGWLFGTGFPKSLNLGDGRGTALKPAWEPICLARKPLVGTVAANVQQHGTGTLNIDACRIEAPDGVPQFTRTDSPPVSVWGNGLNGSKATGEVDTQKGRWPANVCHDGSDEVVAAFPESEGQSGAVTGEEGPKVSQGIYGDFSDRPPAPVRGDSGSAARFFFSAKTSRTEREAGLEDFDAKRRSDGRAKDIENPRLRTSDRANIHPTVKPIALMRWLVRLVTPKGGTVLDPFAGSFSTGVACVFEGDLGFIGIEREAEYFAIGQARMREAQGPLFAP